MAITFSYQKDNFELKQQDIIIRWISGVIQSHQCRVGNINYLFCDDEYELEANRKYLNHDTYTDIITFDYVSGTMVSGDIMISVDRVLENAKKFSVSFEQELRRVIIHGVLHLLGQGDKTPEDEVIMHRREDMALQFWNTIE